jgi:hypothetical protein
LQAYVQTNDDAVDQELQTDETESRNKWTQHPSDDNTGCGGDTEDGDKLPEKIDNKPINFTRLEKFVREAGRVSVNQCFPKSATRPRVGSTKHFI